MTSAPVPQHYAPTWGGDIRTAPPSVGDERELLSSFLDWHRATFELKCSGILPELRSERAVAPSGMSLHGLVRHLAAVERWWFRIQFAGEDVPMLHYSDEDPDQDFADLTGDSEEALALWRTECGRSREIVAAAATLDEEGTRKATGEPFSLRWLLVHLIAEYARHNGHADLLRERLDGATGV
ncbi:DinB family protein [Streptomyces sp. NPDC051567]|uniref:DinB family protein n=1 Tax=Streptomyces sp. NPDC051567 TaxID=3365660 RepID=UPI00379755C6